jgi:fumarate hydratase class II
MTTNLSASPLESSPLQDDDAVVRKFLRRNTIQIQEAQHPHSGETRVEHDSMGEIHVPADHLWGAQTQRSFELFNIEQPSGRMPVALIRSFGIIKRAAAIVNQEQGLLKPEVAEAIVTACDEVIDGKWLDEFPLVVWQTGSGTQTVLNPSKRLILRI